MVRRRYYVCRGCQATYTPWDEWAGLQKDHLTPHARRLVVLAGSNWSFDLAQVRLKEFCGLRVSDQTIRRVTEAAGQQARVWQVRSAAAGEAFRAAGGEAEYYMDLAPSR